jgi:hypothetical protein
MFRLFGALEKYVGPSQLKMYYPNPEVKNIYPRNGRGYFEVTSIQRGFWKFCD